jgi:hypothetical protein
VKVTTTEFVQMKARFEHYLRSVPRELWFAGRRDAPSPERQLHAVQKMFGIDCSSLGANPAPQAEPCTGYNYSRELRVAVSRLEQWERGGLHVRVACGF